MIFSYDLVMLFSSRRETILVFVQIRTTYHTKGKKKKFYMQKKQVGLSKAFPASIFIRKEPLFQLFLFNTQIQVQKKYIKNGPTKSNNSTITLGLRP